MPDQRQWFVLAGCCVDDSENHEHDEGTSDEHREQRRNASDNGNHRQDHGACHGNEYGDKQHDSLIGMVTREFGVWRGKEWNQEEQSDVREHSINFVLLDVRRV